MVSVNELSPGMRVKIVDKWDRGGSCRQNNEGYMDEYLGQIVTISDIEGPYVEIEEDHGRWCWNAYCFDYIVYDENQEDFEVSSEDEILSLIFGR